METTEELSVPDLLQFAAMNRTTRGLLLFGKSANGRFDIVEGQVVHAMFGELVGEEAVYSALGDPELRAQPAPRSIGAVQRSVFRTIPHLLLEGARRTDEGLTHTPQVREVGPSSGAFGTGAGCDTLLPTASAPLPTRSRALYWTAAAAIAGAVGILTMILLAGKLPPKAPPAEVKAAAIASAALPATAVELTSEMVGPKINSLVLPPRPDVGIAISPTIVVRTLIDGEGRVRETQIYRSRLDLAPFEEAAIAYVRNAHFAPATKNGAPLAVWMNYPVSFAPTVSKASTLTIHGSDTIGGALGPELAKRFEEKTRTKVIIQALGSASAFSSLFADTAQLGASSRPIDAKELARARSLGIELSEFVLGYDGIAVIVNRANPRDKATIGELSAIFSGQKGSLSTATASGDAESLHLYGRPSYSGTHSFFRSKVLRLSDDASERDFASSTVLLEKSEELASRVAQDPRGIGYVGLGALRDDIKALAIAPSEGKPAVLPNLETIRSGRYPIYRPLLFYAKGRPDGSVVEFLRFALGAEGQTIVKKHGFVPTDVSASLSSLELPSGAATPHSQVFRITFAEGSVLPDRGVGATLSEIVEHARSRKSRVLVVGNSDSRGQVKSNEQLAAQRAARVATDLRILGIAADRIRVESSAASAPVDTNDSSTGRAANRRVDVFLVDP